MYEKIGNPSVAPARRQDRASLAQRDLDNLRVGSGARKQYIDPDDVVTERTQELDGARCDVRIGEQPHATAEVRSLASHAPKRAA